MSERVDLTYDLERLPVGKLIVKMSVPSVIGVMAYNVYNLFDTMIVSRGAGMDALGGVAVSFPLFLFLSAVSSTLGGGAASVISRALGEHDRERAAKAAGNTMALFYLTAILITVFGLLFLEPLLYAMGVTDTLLPYAKRYMRIILLGAVTTTGFSGLIRAEGNSRYAMYIWLIPMSANIVLDILFVFGLGMGETGAALGTVLAQSISTGMSIYYFFLSGKSVLHLSPRHFVPSLCILREVIMIGIPSFLQLSGHGISILIVNLFLKQHGGDPDISAYGIVSKLHALLLFPVTGLSQGIQPIIGYNHGAGDEKRVKETVSRESCFAAAYSAAAYLAVLLCAEPMLRLFTPESATIEMGGEILKMIGLGLVCSGLQSIQSTCFQAIGKRSVSILLALCDRVLCFVPVIAVLSRYFQMRGIWLSFPVSAMFAFLISSMFMAYFMLRQPSQQPHKEKLDKKG